jgi:hypothetical protein
MPAPVPKPDLFEPLELLAIGRGATFLLGLTDR